eukprot:5645672-Amphidinium_carterae.1
MKALEVIFSPSLEAVLDDATAPILGKHFSDFFKEGTKRSFEMVNNLKVNLNLCLGLHGAVPSLGTSGATNATKGQFAS